MGGERRLVERHSVERHSAESIRLNDIQKAERRFQKASHSEVRREVVFTFRFREDGNFEGIPPKSPF